MSRRRRRPDKPAPARSIPDILYPTLDLHGRSEAEAVRVAARWLAERTADAEPVVRIVTGRGLHSVGLPVLPQAISEMLSGMVGHEIRSYEREPGGGAFRVQLHAARRPTRSVATSAPVPAVDPEIVRQAEEALAELGVDRTPALLEAEIRRIVKELKDAGG